MSGAESNSLAGSLAAAVLGYDPFVQGLLRQRTMILLGHSFENLAGIYTGSTPWYDYQQGSWFAQGNAALGWAYDLINPNAGVGGNTSSQIYDRFGADSFNYRDVYGHRADRVSIGGGTNDDLTSAAKVSAAFDFHKSMFDRTLQGGQGLTVRTDTPKNADTTAQIVGIHALNQLKRQYCEINPAQLFDLAAALCNPETGLLCAAGAYGALFNMYVTDGVHLSDYAGSIAGKLWAIVHAPFVPPASLARSGAGGVSAIDVMYNATNGVVPSGNLIANGKMLGTTGTNAAAAVFPGNLATGWNAPLSLAAVPATGGSGSISKVARTDLLARGEFQQVQILPGASTQVGFHRMEKQSIVDTGETVYNGTRGLSIGDEVVAQCDFEADALNWCGADGLSPTTMELRIDARAATTYAVLAGARCFPGKTPNGYPQFLSKGVLRTPRFTLPAGAAHVYITILFQGVGTARFSEVVGRKSILT